MFRIAAGLMVIAVSLAADDGRQFEVASIRLDPSCRNRRVTDERPIVSAGRVQWSCITLERLIQFAYVSFANGVSFSRQVLDIAGGPDWMRSDQYDVAAKADGTAGVAEMSGPMLQRLLEDRFQLKIHRETKEARVYALTVAKKGLKLTPALAGACVARDLDHLSAGGRAGFIAGIHFCNEVTITSDRRGLMLEGYGMKIAELAQALNFDSLLDRPVLDQTGYKGVFDFQLRFAPTSFGDNGGKSGGRGNPDAMRPPRETDGPAVFEALQEQLGLKLVDTKGPVGFLVIDRVERPSDN